MQLKPLLCSIFLTYLIITIAYAEPRLEAVKHSREKRDESSTKEEESWTGRWLPERTTKTPHYLSEMPLIAEGGSPYTTGGISSTFESNPSSTVGNIPAPSTAGNIPSTTVGAPAAITQGSPSTSTSSGSTTTVDPLQGLRDDVHGIKMGIPDIRCDNGKVNITFDWDGSPVNYTCYNPSHLFIPDSSLPALLEHEDVPANFVPSHTCMQNKIVYDRPVPTFGNHRPLWPKYGEYKFLPIQRWLHSTEHGAIVMLYHPCANPVEVNRLRKLVKGCIWRHIVTPYTLLDEKYPMVLVAWGSKLYMSTVDAQVVRAFIREEAGHGWEGYDVRQGYFDLHLELPAVPPPGSDYKDKIFCPNQ